MNLSRIITAVLITVILAASTFAQGKYVESGTSAFGFSAGFSSNSDASAIVGRAGFSASGLVDFDLGVGKLWIDDADMSAIAIAPSMSVYILKQDSISIPISIAVGFGYERDSYSSDALRQAGLKLTGNYFSFGMSIFGNIPASPAMTVQPRGSVSYTTGTLKLSDDYGNSLDEDDHLTSFAIGLSMYFETSPQTVVGVHPSIGFSENYTTFRLSIGMIFPMLS